MNIDMNLELGLRPRAGSAGTLEPALRALGQVQEHPAGSVLVQAGRCTGLRLILEGSADCWPEDDRPRRRLGPGEYLGAHTHLFAEPARATVLARAGLVTLELGPDRLAAASETEALALDAAIVAGLRTAQREQAAPVIALVPGHAGAPTLELGQQLARALTELEPGVHLVVEPRPRPDEQWRAWLASLRRTHRCVVLVCDEPGLLDELGRWPTTHTCVVVDTARPARARTLDSCYGQRCGRVSLALVQPRSPGPHPGTRQWLAHFDAVHGHHHVCLDDPRSLARLARILDGRATSLILGAGGCRGFAHVGVYRALVEAGIELDFVAGTSIGAVVGGLIAHDWEPDRLEHVARKVFAEGSSILDLGPSPTSLLAGERLAAGFRAAYGEVEIEDLPIPFACTSTDLVEQRARVHERGRLWKLSKASGSMPGAAPPVRVEGAVLVDGGVLNPLPLELARTRHEGRVLAVNLVPDRPSSRFDAYHEREGVGAWLRARSRVHLGEVVRRSLQVRATRDIRARRRGDELWIEPPLEGVGVFEHRRYEEIVERGYRYTKELLRGC